MRGQRDPRDLVVGKRRRGVEIRRLRGLIETERARIKKGFLAAMRNSIPIAGASVGDASFLQFLSSFASPRLNLDLISFASGGGAIFVAPSKSLYNAARIDPCKYHGGRQTSLGRCLKSGSKWDRRERIKVLIGRSLRGERC